MERHPLMDDDAGEIAAARAARVAKQGTPHEMHAKVLKVQGDGDLGLVLGWAIICEEDGVPYFDTQDDHIPEASMLKAATDFAMNSRVLGDMHRSAEGGSVVHTWPMTKDIAEAFGITTKTTGLMIAVKPATSEMLEKFRSGEYTGFSIGGRRLVDEDVE